MKIDVGRIVVAHIRTLRDSQSSKISLLDMAVFFGVPVLAGAGTVVFRWGFNSDVLIALLTAFSIFAGLLLNLLILVYTFSTQANHPSALAKVRGELVKELHDNIAYSILVSIVLVVLSIVAIAYMNTFAPPKPTNRWVSATIAFMTANFVLTLLMVLKRIYIMINREIDKPAINKMSA